MVIQYHKRPMFRQYHQTPLSASNIKDHGPPLPKKDLKILSPACAKAEIFK
jgi:hypothetical protein